MYSVSKHEISWYYFHSNVEFDVFAISNFPICPFFCIMCAQHNFFFFCKNHVFWLTTFYTFYKVFFPVFEVLKHVFEKNVRHTFSYFFLSEWLQAFQKAIICFDCKCLTIKSLMWKWLKMHYSSSVLSDSGSRSKTPVLSLKWQEKTQNVYCWGFIL